MANAIIDSASPPRAGSARLACLGFCERVAYVREGHPLTWRHNIIGLRSAVLNYFHPAPMTGWHLVLACFDAPSLGAAYVRLVDETGEQLIRFDLRIEMKSGEAIAAETPMEQRHWRLTGPFGPDWTLIHFPLDALVLKHPGSIHVLFSSSASEPEANIGTLSSVTVDPPPLTEDRIAAIRSDPHAAKFVQMTLACKKCPSALTVVAAIERPTDADGVAKVWYQDLPEKWVCSCGATTIDLTSIRRNFHGALGTPLSGRKPEGDISFIRMYERGSLASLTAEFAALLETTQKEQDIQTFLEAHPVFLHRFSPTRIKPKAPILTHYVTDFAILDSRGILLLVEIEPAAIKLLKAKGDVAQALQHAFDQVRAWLDVSRRQWGAVLECIGLRQDEVAGVRGVVIAGRDRPYASQHLLRLKGTDHGQLEFHTFDDLLEDSLNLARELV